MNNTKRMLVMLLVWVLLGGGCFVCAKEGEFTEQIPEEGLWIRGLKEHYLKGASALEVSFEAGDGADGLAVSVSSNRVGEKESVSSNDLEENPSVSGNSLGDSPVIHHGEGRYTAVFEQPGVYRITATSATGETRSVKVLIEQDSLAPEITYRSAVNDSGYTVVDADGIYYFKEQLQVELMIGDEVFQGEVRSPVRLLRNGLEIGTVSDMVTDTLVQSGTYQYTVMDEAGNRGEHTVEIMAVKTSAQPSMQVFFDQEPVMVEKQAYFPSDPKPVLEVTSLSGIAKVEYKIKKGEYILLEDYVTEEVCQWGEHTSYRLDHLSDLAEIGRDGVYEFAFRAVDVMGNQVEQSCHFCIDGTAPDPQIFVSYQTEPAQGGVHTGIQSLLRAASDWIFGRTSIMFELYVRDQRLAGIPKEAVSGLDLQDLTKQITTANREVQIQNIRILEETAEVSYEGITYEGYTHISGILSLPAKQKGYATDCLKINRLKDRVGNCSAAQGTGYTGTTLLYLDSVEPVLSVDYGDGVIDSGQQKIFYKKDAVLGLSLKEDYYSLFTGPDGKPVAPEVTVTGEESDRALLGEWTAAKDGAFAQLTCPASKSGTETEYQFSAAYRDGAGNSLVAGAGGAYREYALVVDQRAPELTTFMIQGDTRYKFQGANVYQQKEGEDVTIVLAIDDHASYWNPDALTIQIYNQTKQTFVLELEQQALTWDVKGRIHTTSFSFDGEKEEAMAEYYITVAYEDRAGNPLIRRNVTEGSLAKGEYTSEHFILDHQAPIFEISYSKAERLVKETDTSEKSDRIDQVPTTGCTAYYREAIQVSISWIERCKRVVYKENICSDLADCKVLVTGEKNGIFVPEIVWDVEGDRIQGSFLLTEEDRYTILVEYTDMASNPMEGGSVQGSRWAEGVVDGTYQSTDLVLDQTAPVIKLSYTDNEGEECPAIQTSEDGYQYFAQPVWLRLTIEDSSMRLHELKEELKKMQVSDRLSHIIPDSTAEKYIKGLDASRLVSEPLCLSIPLTAEGNYECLLGCTDLAGNAAEVLLEKISVDWSEPELELTYEVAEAGFLDVIRYRDLGYLFADSRLTITATAKDTVSGIQDIHFLITEEDGRQRKKTATFSPSHQAVSRLDLPLSATDFKGTVLVQAVDWSGGQTEQSYGHVVESAQKHKETSSARITTLTSPGRTYQGVDYYAADVRLELAIEDSYAGLKKVSYTAGKTLSYSADYAAQKKKEAVTHTFIQELTLSALDNNENEVLVKAEYEDNAGHKGVVEQHYQIDVTPPVLKIVYKDQIPSHSTYYRQARVATVTVQERNFNPEDVEFVITNTEGVMPVISAFRTTGQGDDTLHTCEVVFAADGDYTFTASCMDLAGNRAAYSRVDAFTIDQTKPQVTVNYDPTGSTHAYYYARPRTATIDLYEHNFDSSQVEIAVTAEEGVPVPVVSGFATEGDHHVARILFQEDGEYTFTISGTDLADNALELYRSEAFRIDQTPPRLEISGVQDQSANHGVVAPLIRCQDANFDREGVQIMLEGYHNGLQNIDSQMTLSETGAEIQMEDFVHASWADDLYRLEVTARDLAGNTSEKTITFSVNRYGSVYTLDDKTEQLAGPQGRYYTNQEQEIVVTETNVDMVKIRKITCSLNGKLRTMVEGVDYTMQEYGSKDGWKQYVYTMDKHNFSEEGTYILTFYSEDRAENTSDNQTKGKKIEFVVDKTCPSVVLSGVEPDAQYQENKKEILLDVQDNILLQEVKVRFNDTERIYQAAELWKLNGQISCLAKKDAHWQNLQVTACDAAGNEYQTENIRFLLTSDLVVQFFMNKALAGCFFAGVSIIIALGAWICTIFQRRRHHL